MDGELLTDGEVGRHVLDLHVVKDDRLRAGTVYKITSPSGHAYIGLTRQLLADRMKQHRDKESACKLIRLAITKYGWDAMKIEVLLSDVPDELLEDEETRLIIEHNTLAPNGYNLQTGGQSGFKRCDESRERQSHAVAKSWEDPRIRQNRSSSISKSWMSMSPAARQDRNYHAVSCMHTPESVAVRFDSFKKKRWDKYERLKANDPLKAHKFMLQGLNRDIRNRKEGAQEAKNAYLEIALSVGRAVQ